MAWDIFTGLFGGDADKSTSIYDEKVPPPPSGGPYVPPPKPPRWFKSDVGNNSKDYTFKGFTPPPKINVDANYESEDYSDYTMGDKSSALYNKSGQIFNRLFSTPRASNCFESVKMGWKMGGAVGGIFGTITGLYTSLRHRNLMILPVSAIGGAISFGFFLGCGMIVRC